MNTTAEHQARVSERSVTLGKYRVIAKLGTGGMAEVYLAVAQGAMNVNRLVVVKRLKDDQAGDPESREMFLNEARLAARLSHPNVVQTFEAGVEGGSYYLAMEYVEGQPFSRVLTKLKQDKQRLDPKIAARVVADALAGLHYAHELTDFDGTPLAIVHRDVSPQNMMLTYGGVTKIVDFGIAKAAGSTQTAHGVFKGKVAFMAPEQVLGENVDGRADVFAAGIVLWEAITGKHLMAGESPAVTLNNLMNKPIPRASAAAPDVPPALDDICARALERDLDKRYPTAKAMRDDLEAFLVSAGGISHETVGELLSTMFADRKQSVQEQVRAQLAAMSLSRATQPDIHAISATHVRPATVIDLSEISAGESQPSKFSIVTIGSGVSAVPAPAPRTSRLGTVALLVVAAGALGVSGVALRRSQMTPAAAATPTVVTVTVPAVVTPPSANVSTASGSNTGTSTGSGSGSGAGTSTGSGSGSGAGSGAGSNSSPRAETHTSAPHAPPPPPAPASKPTPVATVAPAAAPLPEPRPVATTAPPAATTADRPQGRTFRREL